MATDAASDELIEGIVASGPAHSADDPQRVGRFLRQYFAPSATDDLNGRQPAALASAALAHLAFGEVRPTATSIVQVTRVDAHAAPARLVVDVVTDDMPFVVDSVTMELGRRGFPLLLLAHPVFRVRRDGAGRLLEVLATDVPPSRGERGARAERDVGVAESFLHIELSARGPSDPDELRGAVLAVLDDVRAAVDDWSAMKTRALRVADSLELERLPVDATERSETAELLRWMAADRFTFVGYREYDLVPVGPDDSHLALRRVAGSGLGILRTEPGDETDGRVTALSPAVSERSRLPTLLNLTKTTALSTIHRPTRLDYVGVKRFDDYGRVIGERRFLGLYTSMAYNSSAFDVPVLRRKAIDVIARAGFPRSGHSTRQLVEILESYPRDELLQISTDELFDNAMGILRLHDRQRVRLFRRVDPFGRFVSCLVYVPRDRYTTAVREQMRDILQRDLHGTSVDYTARITESPLALLHFVVFTNPDDLPPFDNDAIEAALAGAARSWRDDLHDAVVAAAGGERGAALFERFGDAFPASYRDESSLATAVDDIERLDALAADDLSMALYQPDALDAPDAPDDEGLRLKLYRSGGGLALSDVLPVLERAGMTVVDERPYDITAADGAPRWIYDFGLTLSANATRTVDRHRRQVLDGLGAVWWGEADNDGLNRLMLEAGLSWRQVVVLRVYRKYLRQIGSTFSQPYIERCLTARPELVRLLLALFDARFNPDRPLDESESRQADIDALALQVEVALELIDSLDEDRIFRSFYRLMGATTRTTFYQLGPDGRPKSYVAVKLDPRSLADLPEPKPAHEIFVHSPRLEGVHLRGGDVARGGLRWSDRPEDFRTEILGLMKAQLVKNSVIVPVGAKGGFVVRRPPPDGDRDALQQEGIACYRDLVSALLDLTDNLVDGVAVRPERTVCHDDDDPYLVVAADKGTATFSDIANELALARGYWLGDAFASGGSSGYDHKRMGITARGAWESVKRHFRELGVDLQSTDVTVVGIGDMSGDVFGNAMLLSRHLRVIGAFDHRHVFLDPDPDPAVSFAERRRLFDLPRSSWDDYDRSKLSAGGGVYPRTAKSIPLTEPVRAVLGVTAEALAPPDLIRALLEAPVDLLWNGGVGTYVKASTEANSAVGDKTNDVVRVDGADLRCRVVGEGGNLGFTQRGRVEYALAGGRIFTDAIDNSAGVDCSDHEVNIKILLDSVVRSGEIDESERDRLLVEMTDEVAALVIADNAAQTQALSIARTQAVSLADVHARYISSLEHEGRLDRALEFLPTDKELGQRRAGGQGLTTPELAILLAYTKVSLDRALLTSDLPDDPYLVDTLSGYFPVPLRERFETQIADHPLRREIVSTRISNEVVNRGGTSFLYRLSDETQAPLADIAGCSLAAAAIFDVPDLWQRIDELDGVDPAVQTRMLLATRRLVERGARWLLQNRPAPLDITDAVAFFAPSVHRFRRRVAEFLVGDDFDRARAMAREWETAGVPADLATIVSQLDAMVPVPDLVEVAATTGGDIDWVASVYFTVGHRLRFDWLRDQIVALPRDDRWRSLARSSLLGDLYARHRAIASQIVAPVPPLAVEPDRSDPNPAIDAWLGVNQATAERYHQLIGDIDTADSPDLAVLSVALRVVQTLAEATSS